MNSVHTTENRVILTPELAKYFMTMNDPRQRPINYSWAHQIARDISTGRYNENIGSDPIDFNVNGYMQNGQHRCIAVQIANESIPVTVRKNCPVEWFEYYDRSKTRTVNDYCKGKYKQTVISVAEFAIAYRENKNLKDVMRGVIKQTGGSKGDHTTKANIKPTVNEKLEYIKIHGEELEIYATLGNKVGGHLHGGSKSAFACALWLLNQYGVDSSHLEEMIFDFCEQTPRDENLQVLKMWAMRSLAEMARKNSRPNKTWSFALALGCYEAYESNAIIKKPKAFIDNSFDKYCELMKKGNNNE